MHSDWSVVVKLATLAVAVRKVDFAVTFSLSLIDIANIGTCIGELETAFSLLDPFPPRSLIVVSVCVLISSFTVS